MGVESQRLRNKFKQRFWLATVLAAKLTYSFHGGIVHHGTDSLSQSKQIISFPKLVQELRKEG